MRAGRIEAGYAWGLRSVRAPASPLILPKIFRISYGLELYYERCRSDNSGESTFQYADKNPLAKESLLRFTYAVLLNT